MKLKTSFFLSLTIISLMLNAQDNRKLTLSNEENISVEAINHATMKIMIGDKVMYTDPCSDRIKDEVWPKADLILVTDIHRDHYSLDHIKVVLGERTQIVVPQAVFELLPEDLKPRALVLENGASESIDAMEIGITAIAMYNLDPEKKEFHVKGRGNGYVLEKNGFRIYISGDTEDIPEMRELKNIDVAFICMNEPYTMNIEKAASAVIEFKPKLVIPYHYRNGDKSLSDVSGFSKLVESEGVSCILLNWY